VVRASSLYRTAPHEASGPDFINAVAQVETQLDAMQLLAQLQAIENAAGRERPYRNAPRTLDLDLLLYGGACMASKTLVVPHPRMNERAFVLVPLAEIAPALVSREQLDAVAGQPIERLA
jgi:2-amino-4-hydroxy-6-hydroxymethyldihydropteridine diphosphokinase